MAVPVTITDLTTTVASNSPQGSDAIGTNADDYIRALSAILKESGATLYTATGTDTITFSTTPTFSAYASGQRFFVKAAAANTGAVTVNINTLGAKNVLKSGATALAAGDIPAANAHFLIEYDGTQFQLLNAATISAFPVGAVGAPSIYMTGYTTTGWYNIGANNWGFAVSGAKVLDVSSTGLSVTGAIISTSASLHALSPLGAQAATRLYLSSADQTSATYGLAVGDSAGNTALIVKGDRSVVLGASIATVSSTGLAVTGAISATTNTNNLYEAVTLTNSADTSAGMQILTKNGYGNLVSIDMQQVDNGAGANDGVMNIKIATNSTLSTVASISSTGLAVTGTLSATGLIGGRSSNGQAFTTTNGVDADFSITLASGDVQLINTAFSSKISTVINGTARTQVSSTGLAVTGEISATGALTLSGTGQVLIATAASAADKYATISNTNGTLEYGVLAGGEGFIGTSTADNLKLQVNGSVVGNISSTGLAVTGTLSATGAITETTGAAWTAYTPTISADSGSFTGQTINSARYRVLGKTLFISISVSSTGVTGAPRQIRITAPGAQTYGRSAQNIACPIINGGTVEIGTVRAYDVLGFIVERCGNTAFTGATAATFNGVFETE